MGRVLAWLGAKLRALVGLILPVFQKAKAPRGLGSALRVLLQIIVLGLILVALFWLNPWVAENWLRSEHWLIKKAYLPILALLVFALCWLSYWLWKLLVTEDEGEQFPDIDAAWQEAQAALHKAGLSLTDLPLFLILGQPEDDEATLFQAAHIELVVNQAPPAPPKRADPLPDAPLHLYASRDAIYLTCAGASLMGCLAQSLAGKIKGTGLSGAKVSSSVDDDDFLTRTLTPQARGIIPRERVTEEMAQVLREAEREGRQQGGLNKVDKRELRRLVRRDNPERSPLRSPDVISLQTARLRYLCRLLVRDRQPFCPVNGVLLLVPFAGTDSDQDAAFTGDVLARDLEVTGAVLKVDCPHTAMVCDLETAPGFTEFVQRFRERDLQRRLGQSAPLLPDFRGPDGRPVDLEGAPARMLASLADWVCSSVVPTWVYNKFDLEKKPEDDRAALVRMNSRLFLLADELKQRSQRLGGVLARGLAPRAAKGPLLLGGCYMAGTGTDAAKEQAFVKGVMDLLIDRQSFVYWNARTLAEEAVYAWWLVVGWTILGILILGMLGLALYAFFTGGSPF
jgi:hypothetical protein